MLRRKGELDSMGRCFEDSDRMCFSTTILGNFVYFEIPTKKISFHTKYRYGGAYLVHSHYFLQKDLHI